MDRNDVGRDTLLAGGFLGGSAGPIDRAPAALALRAGEPLWSDARQAVLPLLQRRLQPRLPEAPLTVRFEPGVLVGFGLDLGPFFLHVTGAMVRRWGLEEGGLARQAIGNLRDRARRLGSAAAVRARFGLTPASVLQVPDGWASSLILVADLLPRWFGEGPCLFLAPARNLLIALPATTDRRLARWLGDAVAGSTPQALNVPLLVYDGERLCRTGQGERTNWYTPPDRSVT